MEKSVDSIGSCSLDVDADTTDFSDTSGSLNLVTPISFKELGGEITLNVGSSLAHVNEKSSTEPLNMTESKYLELKIKDETFVNNSINLTNHEADCCDKKPSYLNLACCVNGYSNLTTYDSKIRQDINKSREVSPIRPSASSLQVCKKSNSLVPPVLLSVPASIKKTGVQRENIFVNIEEKSDGMQQSSFIKQRVERLYGPGALAQGFYSPRKSSESKANMNSNKNQSEDSFSNSELNRKFKELSPTNDYIQFRKNLKKGIPVENSPIAPVESLNNNFDLPVLRHLSHEFRAQLPAISPKKCYANALEDRNNEERNEYHSENTLGILKTAEESDVVDKALQVETIMEKVLPVNPTNDIQKEEKLGEFHNSPNGLKDGNYFLNLLKYEQNRLLSLADTSEKYIEILSSNPDIGDDVLGLLRAATGKARLLVNQKLKQFEGLCHKNLNHLPEDKFPTTCDDLQGFWDMVNLQIDNVNTIYEDIENLQKNNWINERESNLDSSSLTSNNSPKTTKPPVAKAKLNGNKTEKSPASSAASIRREMQRKQLLELKRKKKLEMAENHVASTNEQQPIAEDKAIERNITEHNSQIHI